MGSKVSKIKTGKQVKNVNTVVKDFDESAWGTETNLFGEKPEDAIPNKCSHIIQLGNIRQDRKKFSNPQDGRVYSMKGCCPTLHLGEPPRFLIEDDNEYKIRSLSGFEAMRLMGVEDEDIQKLVDGGMSNGQLNMLAGNSIIVNIMSEMFKQLIRY